MQTNTPTLALTTIVQKIDDTLTRGQRWQVDYLRPVLRLLRQTAADALTPKDLDNELAEADEPAYLCS